MQSLRITHIKRISYFFLFIVLLNFHPSSVPLSAQDTSLTVKKLRAVAGAILMNAAFKFRDEKSDKLYGSTDEAPPDAQLRPESPYNDWRYWNGVMNIAMLKLGDVMNEPVYRNFAVKNVAFGFDSYKYFQRKYQGENKWGYPFGQLFMMEELDDCGAMGGSVIDVYRFDKQERYKKYIDQAADHILLKQTRLKDGTFVRSFPCEWTLWADDLYMGLSFLARMGELTGDTKYFNDAAKQVIQFHKYLFDEKYGLMHHCWYSEDDRKGAALWGRANGWALVAQTDLLDRLPKEHPQYDTLLALFRKHISGILRYQESDGLWHQLLDRKDSYTETSCSAMFTYAIARAVNRGYIEPRYASSAIQGWQGVMNKIRPNGEVEGVCTGTVVSENLSDYYNRPAPLNDVHGLGTILLAGAEIMLLAK